VKTDRAYIVHGEITPPDEGGRNGLSDFTRSQLQEAMPRGPRKRSG
jgi:hypothetical protein